MVAFFGWMVKHPDSSLIAAAGGTFQAIWAVTPVIGNSKEFMSGLSVLLATGITPANIGVMSLFVACINLLPIPPLDGFHVARVIVAMVIRREIPERHLLPLQAAGVCLVIALFTVNGVFFTGRLVTGVGRAVQQWRTPPIIGQPESVHYLNGPITISSKDDHRQAPTGDGTKLLAVVLNVDGEQSLMTNGYSVVSQPIGTEYRPLGVLFGKLGSKGVYNDISRVRRVDLQHSTGDGQFVVGLDGDGFSMDTLVEPYVTFLYEVAVDDEEFKLRYDGAWFTLKADQTR